MQFKLTKVVFKNVKFTNNNGKEVCSSGFYLEAEGVKAIQITPRNKEDYKILEYLAEKKFSDYEPKIKDNSEALLK